jgi:hypothetical protein
LEFSNGVDKPPLRWLFYFAPTWSVFCWPGILETSCLSRDSSGPWIEFSPKEGQHAPTLVHYFSDRCDPFNTVLPQLIEGAGGDEERVFVVESPLSEMIDETIALHRHPDFPNQVIIDERHRAFFEAVKLSLTEAMGKIEEIESLSLTTMRNGRAVNFNWRSTLEFSTVLKIRIIFNVSSICSIV